MNSTFTWIFSYPRSENLSDGWSKYENVTYCIRNKLQKNLQSCQIKYHVFYRRSLQRGDDRELVVLNSQLRKELKHRVLRRAKEKKNNENNTIILN
jgi:hypothetical protein